jgi:hypothetical protein
MTCKCEQLEGRVRFLEEWVDDFIKGAEAAEQVLREEFGEVEVTFVPDPALFRDKKKDN